MAYTRFNSDNAKIVSKEAIAIFKLHNAAITCVGGISFENLKSPSALLAEFNRADTAYRTIYSFKNKASDVFGIIRKENYEYFKTISEVLNNISTFIASNNINAYSGDSYYDSPLYAASLASSKAMINNESDEKIPLSEYINAFYTFSRSTMSAAILAGLYYSDEYGNIDESKLSEIDTVLFKSIDILDQTTLEQLRNGFFKVACRRDLQSLANELGINLDEMSDIDWSKYSWADTIGVYDKGKWVKLINGYDEEYHSNVFSYTGLHLAGEAGTVVQNTETWYNNDYRIVQVKYNDGTIVEYALKVGKVENVEGTSSNEKLGFDSIYPNGTSNTKWGDYSNENAQGKDKGTVYISVQYPNGYTTSFHYANKSMTSNPNVYIYDKVSKTTSIKSTTGSVIIDPVYCGSIPEDFTVQEVDGEETSIITFPDGTVVEGLTYTKDGVSHPVRSYQEYKDVKDDSKLSFNTGYKIVDFAGSTGKGTKEGYSQKSTSRSSNVGETANNSGTNNDNGIDNFGNTNSTVLEVFAKDVYENAGDDERTLIEDLIKQAGYKRNDDGSLIPIS